MACIEISNKFLFLNPLKGNFAFTWLDPIEANRLMRKMGFKLNGGNSTVQEIEFPSNWLTMETIFGRYLGLDYSYGVRMETFHNKTIFYPKYFINKDSNSACMFYFDIDSFDYKKEVVVFKNENDLDGSFLRCFPDYNSKDYFKILSAYWN